MKFVVAVGAAVLLWSGAAQAEATPHVRCLGPARFNPLAFTCSHDFIATAEPRTFQALGRGWGFYASRWVADDGQDFVAKAADPSGCRDYGRYGDLRVKEVSCDGRLVVMMRSVGAPVAVRFAWEAWPCRKFGLRPQGCGSEP